ncbi:hypothetical protein ES703_117725 [subsurface metagenome]
MPKTKKIKPIKKVKSINEVALLSAVKKLRNRPPWPAPAERMTPNEQIALNEAHLIQIKYEQKKRHLRRMAKLDDEEGFSWPMAHMRIKR